MNGHMRFLYLVTSFMVLFGMAGVGLARVASAAPAHARQSGAVNRASYCKKHRDKATGTILYSDWEFPDTLNPVQTGETVSQETINGLFDGLFMYDARAHLRPEMATAIPSVKNGGIKNGGRTYVIHLKQGLRWSNNTEVTSADIKFSWRIGMNKLSGPACSGTCDVISRIDTPDKYTAVIHLKRPYAPFLTYGIPLIWPTAWPNAWNNNPTTAAKTLYQSTTFNFEGPNFPTDGPYQVHQYLNNDRIVLHPMPYYDDMTCGGYVKNLIFAFYSSKNALIAAAGSGQTDVSQDYTPADIKTLHAFHTFKTSVVPSFNFEHIEFNVDKTYHGALNPVGNTKVRQALALALDKVGVIESALGVNRATAMQIIGWTPWLNTRALTQPFTDKKIDGQWDPITGKYVIPGTASALRDARKLLASTPFNKGFTLDFYTTSGNTTRQAEESVMANSWHKLGVTVNPNYIPASKLVGTWDENGQLDHGDFQVTIFFNSTDPDPDALKFDLQSQFVDRNAAVHAPINGNYAGVDNKLIDRAFNVAASTTNKSLRARNYAVVQEQLVKQNYWDVLYFRPSISTHDAHVLNFSGNPTPSVATWNMFAWRYSRG